jgi:hypothetical protein
MAPRTHYAKSQEKVYKKVGRGYKLVAAETPPKVQTSSSPKQGEASTQLPPVVSGPSDGNVSDTFPDTSFPADDDMPRPKKSGKVNVKYSNLCCQRGSPHLSTSETIRLHEDMAE